MDEIDSKALEGCIRKTLRDYRQSEVADEDGNGYPLVDALTLDGHGIDMGEREIDNIVSELMYVITSKLAALEDENKTLRELVDEALAILARLERDYCSDFTLYDGRPVSDWCAKVAALSKPAALPAEGKGEPIDQSLRDAAKAMGAYEAKNPTHVGGATPSSSPAAQEDGE